MNKFLTNILKKWQLVMYISFILGAMTFLVSTIVTPKYKSEITVLIVQKKVDILVASRNAEYLSNIFEQVLYTESFMDGVLKSDISIKRQFSVDPRERKKEWENEIKSEKIGSTGMLRISVIDPVNEDSYKIALGISKNFKENSTEYFGQKEKVEIKVIDGPITSAKVAYPNIVLNTVLGFIVGLFGSLVIVYFYEDFDFKLIANKRWSKKQEPFFESEIIEKQVGQQLARQLEQRGDKVSLEYLDLPEDSIVSDEAKYNEYLDSVENSDREDLETQGKALVEDSFVDTNINNELEYIEIEDINNVNNEESFSKDIKEGIEALPFRMKSTNEDLTYLNDSEIKIFKQEKGNSFWHNMHAIDNMASSVQESNDNSQLASSMVDMDTYEKIIQAGETYNGHKKLQKNKEIKELGIENIEKKQIRFKKIEEITDNFEKKKKTNDKDNGNDKSKEIKKVSDKKNIVKKKEEKNDKVVVTKTQNSNVKPEKKKAENIESEKKSDNFKKKIDSEVKKQDQTDILESNNQSIDKIDLKNEQKEALELSTTGLKKLLKKDNQKESDKESKVNNQDVQAKKVEGSKKTTINKPISVSESKKINEQKVSNKNKESNLNLEVKSKKEQKTIDEDIDKIVEEKKEEEKKEILELIAKESKNTSVKKNEGLDKKNDRDLNVESIDYIGSDESKSVEAIEFENADDLFNSEEIQRSDIEKPKKSNIFSRLYEKSIFSDKRYQQQKAERTKHHMEMDPEELDMMKRMLEAEGKSEEEFVVENGLMSKDEVNSIKIASSKGNDSFAENAEPVIRESVKKIKVERDASLEHKVQPPKGLPVFMASEDKQDVFARKIKEGDNKSILEEVSVDGKNKEKKDIKVDPNKEVSEEKIKNKLNKLLQGEL